MRANEIKVGGRYVARVSGHFVAVRVLAIEGKRYVVRNEDTDRVCRFKSVQRFRYDADICDMGV